MGARAEQAAARLGHRVAVARRKRESTAEAVGGGAHMRVREVEIGFGGVGVCRALVFSYGDANEAKREEEVDQAWE